MFDNYVIHAFIKHSLLVILISPLIFNCKSVLSFTWTSCLSGANTQYCTNVFSTECCDNGLVRKARCCSMTSCLYLATKPIRYSRCTQFTQSKCCPYMRIAGSSCCNSAQYSLYSWRSYSSSTSKIKSRSSYSSWASYWSSVRKSRESSRIYLDRSRSEARKWSSFTDRIDYQIQEALDTAKRASDGSIAAGSILGILIIFIISACIVISRKSADHSGGNSAVTLVRNSQAGTNPGYTEDPPPVNSTSTFEMPPPSYSEVTGGRMGQES